MSSFSAGAGAGGDSPSPKSVSHWPQQSLYPSNQPTQVFAQLHVCLFLYASGSDISWLLTYRTEIAYRYYYQIHVTIHSRVKAHDLCRTLFNLWPSMWAVKCEVCNRTSVDYHMTICMLWRSGFQWVSVHITHVHMYMQYGCWCTVL